MTRPAYSPYASHQTTVSFRDALLGAGPESILPAVVMDSGLALRAPRNDGSQPNWLFEKMESGICRVGKAQACPPSLPSQGEGRWARRQRAFAHLRVQSNRLDTDSSDAVRPIASAISEAIDSVRMLGALRTASVGWIESVITSSFSLEPVMRAVAPPDSTPWEM